ncbi:MAG: hypothetical protein J7K87_00185, partial [Candidatus Aenigmarchaeota archaeon]|nr:hypothetical protein [Candidatus Aenigmarchaeota archaeon]
MTIEKKLKKVMDDKKITLIYFKSIKYRDVMKDLVGIAYKKFRKICYITLNDPYATIISNLNIKEEKIVFIDCVTSTVESPKSKKNVIFVSSPHALTEISISLEKAIKNKKVDFVIFDSISAMLIYEDSFTIMKFIHRLVLTFRARSISAFFVIMKEDLSDELMKDLAMFVDKIVGV